MSTCVFTSEEKRQLISVGQDRTLRIWDLKTKRQLKSPSISSVAIALDVNRMDTSFATGHKCGDVKLWSLLELKEVKKQNVHASQITCLKYTPDG